MRSSAAPVPPPLNSNDAGQTLFTDPLSDLLLSVAAILILAVIVVLPTARPAANSAPGRLPGDALPKFQGRPIEPIFAMKDGLRMGSGAGEFVPVDRILDHALLAARLRHMRETGESLLLAIEPDGFEAAFLFEAAAALNGPRRIWQIRLEAECAAEKSRLLAPFCSARDRPGERR